MAQRQGSSSWLTVLPIKRLGFNLSKLDFWDAVRLRYGLPLKRLVATRIHTTYSMKYYA